MLQLHAATALTSVVQLCPAFTAKIFLCNRITGDIKRNATEMRLHAVHSYGQHTIAKQ